MQICIELVLKRLYCIHLSAMHKSVHIFMHNISIIAIYLLDTYIIRNRKRKDKEVEIVEDNV